jgi:hypothetical protein
MDRGSRRRSSRLRWLAALAAVALAVLAATAGSLMAVFGAELTCPGETSAPLAAPTRSAKQEIPPSRLRLYQAAARRFDVEWAFLAAIGTQECGSGTCAGDNGSGCGGPMQIAFVRGTPCSPDPNAPTLWERYGMDANGDDVADVNNPADAIFTAARMLRPVFGLAGDSYAAYRQVACNYYGACSYAGVPYADEVMARAVQYGFDGKGSPPPSDPAGAEPVAAGGGGCGGAVAESGAGPMGPVRKAYSPRRLAALPPDVTTAPGMQCDARIVPNVVYLARRFGILVTSCYAPSGHEATGEHPIGAAIDAGPRDGDWSRTMRLARALGWKSSCGAIGVAPTCAKPPFRAVLYNGFPNHGDPLRCVPCIGGPHIHLSWMTSASEGQPENRARYSYAPASWIEVFTTPESEASPASSTARGGA